jgi:hypothetical protein
VETKRTLQAQSTPPENLPADINSSNEMIIHNPKYFYGLVGNLRIIVQNFIVCLNESAAFGS